MLNSLIKKLTLGWKKYKKVISLVLTALFGVLIVAYVVINWREFSKLDIVHPQLIILLVLASMLNIFSTGRIMDVVLRPLGHRLHPLESYGLAAISRLSNQVTPGQTGLLVRAAYLRKKYGLKGSEFISALAGTHIIIYIAACSLGLVSVVYLNMHGANIPSAFTYVLSGVFVFLSVLVVIPIRFKERNMKGLAFITKSLNGWQEIKQDRKTMALTFVWAFVLLLSVALLLLFSFNSLGASIDLPSALFITSIIMGGGIISITPAGFGINEAFIIIAATGAGVDGKVALAASILQRVVVTGVLLVTTPMVSRKMFGMGVIDTIRGNRPAKTSKPTS